MSLKIRTGVPALLLGSSAAVALAQQAPSDRASAPSAASVGAKGAPWLQCLRPLPLLGRRRGHRATDVTQHKVDDVSAMRKRFGIPERFAGCHVARVGRYVIDGRVPALDILRLLREQPPGIGLAVPDMPTGSPGMERAGQKDPYQVLLTGLDASATVFKSYL